MPNRRSFSRIILKWYAENKRELPWRETTDPYKIWLSEILLQQTRVAQGMPYYLKFIEKYPTVHELASAHEEEVLKLWQGLGYYSRARNLHATAIQISKEMGGQFPHKYEELIKLKGVGDYTASAIASICFNENEAVLDGNVYRVLARYFGVSSPINDSGAFKYFKTLAKEVMSEGNVRDYNQGLMEFGALQCKPGNPDCNACPLNNSCEALRKNMVTEWPLKRKKGKIRKRFFNYLVPEDPEQNTLLRKRYGKGIWQNLYEFPLVETEKEADLSTIQAKIDGVLPAEEVGAIYKVNPQKIVHKLSHQHLHVNFWHVEFKEILDQGIPIDEITKYPVPVVIADFIGELL